MRLASRRNAIVSFAFVCMSTEVFVHCFMADDARERINYLCYIPAIIVGFLVLCQSLLVKGLNGYTLVAKLRLDNELHILCCYDVFTIAKL